MGILNVTPDSFSEKGDFFQAEDAIRHGIRMVEEGADIIDIGAESTRPGAEPVSTAAEMQRLTPVVEELAERINIPISIDTTKSSVAERMLDLGASIVNDISALQFDEEMAPLVSERKCPLIMMHMQGSPRTMQKEPTYTHVITDIRDFLRERVESAVTQGISERNLILDPGIGFGKTVEHNLQIIRHLDKFRELGYPLLIGASRKSFIGKQLDLPVTERLEGSLAAAAIAIWQGADIIRVHDVAASVRTAQMVDAMRGEKEAPEV